MYTLSADADSLKAQTNRCALFHLERRAIPRREPFLLTVVELYPNRGSQLMIGGAEAQETQALTG